MTTARFSLLTVVFLNPRMCATDVRARGRHLATSERKQANQCELSAAMVHALCDSRVSAPLTKPLQQLSDSPRVGRRQPAGFPSVGPVCLPPVLDVFRHQTIGLPGFQAPILKLDCLSNHLASRVVNPLLPALLNKFDNPARLGRLAIICTFPLAAPADVARKTKSFW